MPNNQFFILGPVLKGGRAGLVFRVSNSGARGRGFDPNLGRRMQGSHGTGKTGKSRDS